MNRRELLKTGGAGLLLGSTGFPMISRAVNRKPTLRVMGTHVTLQEPIRKQAEQDLGFSIEFYPGGTAEVLFRAATEPEQFDIYEQWSNSIRVLWQANAVQAIDTRRLRYWPEINSLPKTGKIAPEASMGMGDAPHKLLYVQADGTIGPDESHYVSFLPYVHNADSFGYNSRIIQPGIPYETESWGWFLDPAQAGNVAVINAPAIGLFDLALAVRSQGLMSFRDIGQISRTELDELFEILVAFKRRKHFRGFWSSVPHSVDLMARGEVSLESMFSPASATLRGMGIPCVYAAPREGYRGWYGVMCLSSAASREKQDMAYAYMDWWLSGWPGAFFARQGYYISNPQRSRQFLEPEEWDYWYAGRPAPRPLAGVDGRVLVTEGEERRGGDYHKRFANIAVWNSVMENYEYSLTKWKEFLLA